MQQYQEWIDQLDKMLTVHVSKGIDALQFRPHQKLKISKSGQWLENPQVNVTPEFIEVTVKRLISVNQDRDIESINHHDILQTLGGILEYDVLLPTDKDVLEAKTFKVNIMSGENQELHVDFQLEPDILLGFHQVANPARMNEDQLLNWLDDFGTRMMTLSNPKPKDLIFHPNKHNPYITVTGGLRTIKDIYMEPGGKATEKIARALIKLAQNPSVNAQIDKNNGRLDTLDLDLSYRTKAGRRFRVNLADALLYRQSKLGIKLSVKWDPTGAELDQAINFMDSSLLAEKERLEAEKAKKKKGWDPLDDLNFNFNS